MDAKKTGAFIAQLRHEKNMTQQELGEKLYVTNKTVSRWENGNYIPDINMMQALSKELNVTINELLSGERIPEEKYKEKAEANFTAILHTNSFTLKERCTFFKHKWQKEHLLIQIILLVLFVALYIYGFITNNPLVLVITSFSLFITVLVLYNRMMAYIETHAFDGTGKDILKE